jgi:oligopeptide/dipeptide ABC transporter ATP-binding protein
MRTHLRIAGREIWRCVEEGLARVGIATPAARRRQYPHQMSGGMLQRIVGAIALSCAPELVIADEPTTSLDVTIQAQYLTLLKQLKREFGLALILVSHDLSVIAAMCERVAVMYAGRVVETATTRELFDSPRHPYTIALLRSLPRLDVRLDRLPSIAGQPPDLAELREGCAFAPRCADAMEICRRRRPPTVSLNGRTTECWLHAAQG